MPMSDGSISGKLMTLQTGQNLCMICITVLLIDDRTLYILSVLKRRAFPGGRKVDYLYVDEVQDNLISDIARQLSLVFNGSH